MFFQIVLILLLLETGDIEMNPGPHINNNSLSILHSNIRSIRNKLDYITENFLDFDILCFTESHLDANITTKSLIMSSKYDIPYRIDRTNHDGGLLMYLSCEIAHKRIIGLETFWNESLWVEIKVNKELSHWFILSPTYDRPYLFLCFQQKYRKGFSKPAIL